MRKTRNLGYSFRVCRDDVRVTEVDKVQRLTGLLWG
jgi:hypothetical protein